MGKSQRDKGARFEREIVNKFQANGFAAERVPLSGAAGGSYKGDVSVPILGEDRILEAKKRANGFKEIYKWLGDNYGLVIAADRQNALICLPVDRFIELARQAEASRYYLEDQKDAA